MSQADDPIQCTPDEVLLLLALNSAQPAPDTSDEAQQKTAKALEALAYFAGEHDPSLPQPTPEEIAAVKPGPAPF